MGNKARLTSLLTLAGALNLFSTTAAFAGAISRGHEARLGDVRLTGAVADKMNTLIRERLTGDEARGRIYDEAVNAFRTHYDDNHKTGSWEDGKGLWQGEYWGKTMLSAAVVGDMIGDREFKTWLRQKALRFVAEFQQGDGYLSSYANGDFVGGRVAGNGEIFCWNIWGQKYTMWALLELARVTETPELNLAARRMADNILDRLDRLRLGIEDTGYFVGLPSMSLLRPLLILSERTGESRYREFARKLVKAWDRADNRAPNLIANAFGDKPYHDWYPNAGKWAKAYETMSCLEGLVAYARLEQDERILLAVRRIVGKLESSELNAVGGVGFFDHFTHAAACPNATTEPCDVTHWIRVNRELFLVTDDAHYLDNVEIAFYNAFLAGVYRDGKWGAHSVRSHGSRHRTAPHQVGMKHHQCCIDNMPRTFVDFASTLVTRSGKGVLSVNLYSPGSVRLGDDSVVIEGNYPIDNHARVKIRLARSGSVRFRLGESFSATKVNGERFTGTWRELALEKGDHVFDLEFERSLRAIRSSSLPDDSARSRDFERVDENPEMKGLARKTPALRLMYGPLILAKSLRMGSSREEVFGCQLDANAFALKEPVAVSAEGVWGAWKLTFTNPEKTFAIRVSDFASSADVDDPANAFSIWF